MSEMIKVIEWFGSKDTGMSSKAIALHMTTGNCDGSYPYDPADLGRCLRLLEIFPEWKGRIPEMGKYGKTWKNLSFNWDKIEKSMLQEVGLNWEKGSEARGTYDLMKSLRS